MTLDDVRAALAFLQQDAQKIGADPVGSARAAGTGFARGATVDLAGMPVDAMVNLYNLGKAGAGYAGSKLLGLSANQLPQLTEKKDVVGSSEWLADLAREHGLGAAIDAPPGTSELANMFGNVVAPGPKGKAPKREVMTYHGTPHNVDRYDLSKVGTGEGGQAFGHGMYFAENPEVAKTYRKGGANVYQQDLPDEMLPRMLQLDKPLLEQGERGKALHQFLKDKILDRRYGHKGLTGQDAMELLRSPTMEFRTGNTEHTKILQQLGFPGASYYDAGSRIAGIGTRNHVVWDQDLLDRMVPLLMK